MISQSKCMVLGHDEQQIIGICENIHCKQLYRRVCLDCQQSHYENDLKFELTDIKNDKGIQKIIDEFKQENENKINNICVQSYIQQYFLTIKIIESVEQYLSKNQQLANILNELDKFQQDEWKSANITDYLQNKNNIGIFKYLQQIKEKLQIIDQAKENYILNINNIINQNFQSQTNSKQGEALAQSIQFLLIFKDKIFQSISQNYLYRKIQDNQNQFQPIKELIDKQGQNLYSNILNEQYQQIQYLITQEEIKEIKQEQTLLQQTQLTKNRIKDPENKRKPIQFNTEEGDKFYYRQRYQEAIEMYEQAIKLDPKNIYSYHNKGYSLHCLERYQEAIDMYDIAIKVDPNYIYAYHNKGNSLHSLSRYQEAIDMYDQAIKLNPKYILAYNNKGYSLKIMGNNEDAKQTFKECLKIDPNNYYAKSELEKL